MLSSTGVESGFTAVAAAHESWGWCSDSTKCQHFKHRQLSPGCLPSARCSCCCVFFSFKSSYWKKPTIPLSCVHTCVHTGQMNQLPVHGALRSDSLTKLSFPNESFLGEILRKAEKEAIVEHNTQGLPAASRMRNHNTFLNNTIKRNVLAGFESHGNPTQPVSVAVFVGPLDSSSLMVDHNK